MGSDLLTRAAWLVALFVGCSPASGGRPQSGADTAGPTGAAEAHGGSEMRGGQGPTTEAAVVARLREVADGVPAGAVGGRIAMADVAYPRTQQENVAMGGYGLLLITAVARDKSELPLARAKARTAAGELPLGRAGQKTSAMTDEKVRAVFGEHRSDELYYLPVLLTRVPCQIVIDFAKNRQNFDVLRFPPPQQEDRFPSGISVIEDVGDPDARTATQLAREEFGWKP